MLKKRLTMMRDLGSNFALTLKTNVSQSSTTTLMDMKAAGYRMWIFQAYIHEAIFGKLIIKITLVK